jgi:hypothetical protein
MTITANFAIDPVIINDAAEYAAKPVVTVKLTPPAGLGYVRLSNDSLKWSKWLPVVATVPWKLSSKDGLKTVTAQFAATSTATTGETYSDTIILDTKAPSGKVVINSGAKLTNSTTLAVSTLLKAPDTENDMAGICINENAQVACSDFKPFASPINYTLTVAGDGKKTIFVTLKDKSGKPSKPVKASITLDTTPPDGTILINTGDAVTATPLVALKLTAKGAAEMQVSVDGGGTWGAWEKMTGSKSVTLPAGAGMKIVKARFRDLAGNVSADCEDSIELQ